MPTPPEKVDYYALLDLPVNATTEAIHTNYKVLSEAFDLSNFPPGTHRRNAEEMLKSIQSAFEILSNPEKRRAYDATQRGGVDHGPASTKSDSKASKEQDSRGWPLLPPRIRGVLWMSRLLNEGQDYNSTQNYSGSFHGRMQELACSFVQSCREAVPSCIIQWNDKLIANDSAFAFNCFNGPLPGSDCYIMVDVVFGRLVNTVNVRIQHRIIRFLPLRARIGRFCLRIGVATAFLLASAAVAFLIPLGPDMACVILISLALLQVNVDGRIAFPKWTQVALSVDIRKFPEGGTDVYFMRFSSLLTYIVIVAIVTYIVFSLSGITRLNWFGPRVIFWTGLCVTLHSLSRFDPLKPRDFVPGRIPWAHDNTAIRDAIVNAVIRTIRPRE